MQRVRISKPRPQARKYDPDPTPERWQDIFKDAEIAKAKAANKVDTKAGK